MNEPVFHPHDAVRPGDDRPLAGASERVFQPGATPGGGEPPPAGVIRIGPEHLASRVDFERGMSAFPKLTVALIVVNAVVFALELAHGALAGQAAIVAAGARDNASLAQGELWRFLSPVFLHGSLDHLIGNSIALYILGMGCEHAFGRRRTFTLYIACGILASMASCLSTMPSVGASGAIFGLLGALLAALTRHSRLLHVRDKRIGGVLLIWALYTLGTGAISPMVDNWAHLGGLLAGGVLGAATSVMILPVRPARDTVGLNVALVGCILALVYTGVFFVPRLV